MIRMVRRTGSEYEALIVSASQLDDNLVIEVPDPEGTYELSFDAEDIREVVQPRDNVVSFLASARGRRSR